MPLILDGRTTREALMPALIARVKALPYALVLAVIQVGNRADSSTYIRGKKSFATSLGVTLTHIELPEDITEANLITKIQECNAGDSIHGIIVQLPLPAHIDRDRVIDSIDPRKDVDALTSVSVNRWKGGKKGAIFPATARGVKELLDHYKVNLAGKNVTVVGRSALVGAPIALLAKAEGAIVTVAHSKTADLATETLHADIVISAVGKPHLIVSKHVHSGQVIIDVGITRDDSDALVGDVDFAAVKDTVAAITPVPGGVGPMTVLALFENLVDLCVVDTNIRMHTNDTNM